MLKLRKKICHKVIMKYKSKKSPQICIHNAHMLESKPTDDYHDNDVDDAGNVISYISIFICSFFHRTHSRSLLCLVCQQPKMNIWMYCYNIDSYGMQHMLPSIVFRAAVWCRNSHITRPLRVTLAPRCWPSTATHLKNQWFDDSDLFSTVLCIAERKWAAHGHLYIYIKSCILYSAFAHTFSFVWHVSSSSLCVRMRCARVACLQNKCREKCTFATPEALMYSRARQPDNAARVTERETETI